MALSVLDGNQSATTLSSVVTGGEHIVAHSVVSLGSNAISNITTAVSGSIVTIPNLNVLARSVATDGITDGTLNFVKIGGHQDGSNQTAHIVHVSSGGAMKVDASDSTVTFGAIRGTVTIGNTVTIAGTVTANPNGTQTIAGTVTANVGNSIVIQVVSAVQDGDGTTFGIDRDFPIAGTVTANAGISFTTAVENGIFDFINNEGVMPISGTVTIGSALPTGTNRIGVVTIGGGTVTIGAGTAQIGSVTASLAISSSAITSGSFTSLTSATLVPANTARKMATVYNLGAGQLFVNAGATATTLGGGFMVALSSGDFYECDYTTTTLSAIFATAGTASWMSH